jgi:hypothetical protein
MFGLLVASAVSSYGACFAVQPPPEAGGCWTVDKTTITVGGCVTIVLNDTCSAARRLTLEIGDREPIPLYQAGATMQYTTGPSPVKTTTLVLISHDLASPSAFEKVPGKPNTFRPVPVFNRPGPVRLTLRSPDRDLGSKDITVLPAALEAKEAIGLIYPELRPDRRDHPGQAVWMGFLGVSGSGTISRTTLELIDQLRSQLPIIMRHPDWAEIAEMSIARAEVWADLRAAEQAWRATPPALRQYTEIPPPPEGVIRSLEGEVANPFAKMIQGRALAMLADRERFIRSAPDPAHE